MKFKFFTFLFVLFFSLLVAKNADAYLMYNVDSTDANYSLTSWGTFFGQLIYAPYDGCPSSISINLTKDAGSGNCQMVLYPQGVNNGYGTDNKALSTGWNNFSWNQSLCAGWGGLHAGSYYFVGLSCDPSYDLTFYGSNVSTTYPYGEFGTTSDYGTTIASPFGGAIYDVYAYMHQTVTQDIIYFNQTPTSTCDFQFWDVDGELLDTNNASSYSYGVGYKIDASGFPYFYNDNYPLDGLWNNPYQLQKQSILGEGHIYYARAYICDSQNADDCFLSATNSHIVATSDEYTFIVNPWSSCSSTYVFQGEEAYTEAPSTSTPFFGFAQSCDNLDSITSRALCHAMRFLFVPEESSLDRFSNLKTEMEHKPPFGYISAYTTSLGSLNSSTSTTSTIQSSTDSLSLGFLGDLNIYSYFQTFFEWFFYIIFGFYVYNRFRKLVL